MLRMYQRSNAWLASGRRILSLESFCHKNEGFVTKPLPGLAGKRALSFAVVASSLSGGYWTPRGFWQWCALWKTALSETK